MAETFERLYVNEEEFLEEFGDYAAAAQRLLGDEWHPNYHCDDRVRKNQEYFRSIGEQRQLVFESAAVFHDKGGFSSVQIFLRSSTRTVTVRVKNSGAKLVADKVVDRLDSAQ